MSAYIKHLHTYRMYVCTYLYIHACIQHIYIYMYRCTYSCMSVCIQTYLHTNIHMYAILHKCMHADIYSYAHIYVQTHRCLGIHSYTHGCIQTCIHMWRFLGMLNGFDELTKVTIYPMCTPPLQRAAVLTTLIQGPIVTGWQATWLTYKWLRHTNSRYPR